MVGWSVPQQGNFLVVPDGFFKDNKNDIPIAAHLNQPFHSVDDIRCVLSASSLNNWEEKRRSELKLIFKINSNIEGLNRDLGFTQRL